MSLVTKIIMHEKGGGGVLDLIVSSRERFISSREKQVLVGYSTLHLPTKEVQHGRRHFNLTHNAIKQKTKNPSPIFKKPFTIVSRHLNLNNPPKNSLIAPILPNCGKRRPQCHMIGVRLFFWNHRI